MIHTSCRTHNMEKLTWKIDDEVTRVLHHLLHRDAMSLQLLRLDQHCLNTQLDRVTVSCSNGTA